MQVSELTASCFVGEMIAFSYSSLTMEDATARETKGAEALEAQGIAIGLRLAERLVYREASILQDPLSIARYLGSTLWKALFGKSIDTLKSVDNIFYLVDKNFRWLEGFPKLQDTERIQSTAILSMNASESSDAVDHKNVLIYMVGILKGVTHIITESPVFIHANFSQDEGASFVLDFQAQPR